MSLTHFVVLCFGLYDNVYFPILHYVLEGSTNVTVQLFVLSIDTISETNMVCMFWFSGIMACILFWFKNKVSLIHLGHQSCKDNYNCDNLNVLQKNEVW